MMIRAGAIGFNKQMQNPNRVSGFETNRTMQSSNSQLNLNNMMLQTFASTCESTQPASLTQIKTDLKDKIQSTRERFNQLKQRKRQQQTSQMETCPRPQDLGFAISQGTQRNLYQTYRSSSIQNESANIKIRRDESQGSDSIDRDEELVQQKNNSMQALDYLIIHSLNQKSVKTQIKNVLRNSFKAPIASYKLDGAKLLVNRLQVQLKKRFVFVCEVLNEADPSDLRPSLDTSAQEPKELKDKWRFVRNVMHNIDKQKKQPLQDKTNSFMNQQQQQSNSFVQIQQMFDNFKQMRASSQEGLLSKLRQSQNFSQQSLNQTQTQNENINPGTNIYVLQKLTKKIASKSKDHLKKYTSKAALPPTSNQALKRQSNEQKFMQTEQLPLRASLDSQGDSFISTFRENEYFINYNSKESTLNPHNMLTSRSNLCVEEEVQEGQQHLPLESPMDKDKFLKRREYLNHDKNEEKDHKRVQLLSKIVDIRNKQDMRLSFQKLRMRGKAYERIKKLINRKVQEDRIRTMLRMKSAFVRLIKNCIFKSKFEQFLQNMHTRLLEKSFDKIKENNWVVEERKEVLENLLINLRLKQCFKKMHKNARLNNNLERLNQIFESYQANQSMKRSFKEWKGKFIIEKSKDYKSYKLTEVLTHHLYKRQGFAQLKRQCLDKSRKASALTKIQDFRNRLIIRMRMMKWAQMTHGIQMNEQRQEVIANLLYLKGAIQKKRYFTFWRDLRLSTNIQKQCRTQSALHLLMKPLLRAKETKLKHFGFQAFKRRVHLFNKVKKQLRVLMMLHKQHSQLILAQQFSHWKRLSSLENEAYRTCQKSNKLKSNDKSSSNRSVKFTLQKSASTRSHRAYQDDELQPHAVLRIPQPITKTKMNAVLQEDSPNQESSSEDDFENLNEINRISFEETNLQKFIQEKEEVESMPPLQIVGRHQSEVLRKGQQAHRVQNLRYL